ncbi:hypothetical protein HDU92_005469, partial [Lobulomyces angularis]
MSYSVHLTGNKSNTLPSYSKTQKSNQFNDYYNNKKSERYFPKVQKPFTLKNLPNIFLIFVKKIINNPATRKVFYFLLLNLTFTLVEALYGIWTNSLGLTSDAIHMLFDSTAIIFSLSASVVAGWESNERFTFGYSRVETLTGFLNGAALLFAGFSIIWESIERLYSPPEINTESLLTVSILGFLVNLVGIFAFDHGGMGHDHGHSHGHDHHHGHGHSHSHDHSHNPLMQGMFLHVLADTLGSVGVITSSILIQLYGWYWADPLCSLFIAIMIVLSVWPLLRSSSLILLQRIPSAIENKIPEALNRVNSITDVQFSHSAHFWELSSNNYQCSIKIQINSDANDHIVRLKAEEILIKYLGCKEVNIQIERDLTNMNSVSGNAATLIYNSRHDHNSHDHGSHDHGSHDHGSHDHGSHDHGSHDHFLSNNENSAFHNGSNSHYERNLEQRTPHSFNQLHVNNSNNQHNFLNGQQPQLFTNSTQMNTTTENSNISSPSLQNKFP